MRSNISWFESRRRSQVGRRIHCFDVSGIRNAVARVGLTAAIVLAAAMGLVQPSGANIVTFNPITGGPWGGPDGESPGDCIFTEDAIEVCLEEFHTAGFVAFDEAALAPALAFFGTGQILEVHNILVTFDLAAVPGNPCTTQFLFYDQGGVENIQVNGAALIEANLPSLDGVAVAPGVVLHISTMAVPGGVIGVCVMDGPVSDFGVGGQEFYLEDIRTVCGDCDHLVDYESRPYGETFGVCGGDPPGTLVFTEGGVDVSTALFINAGGPYYDCSRIEMASPLFGLSHICRFSNINHLYDFSMVGCPVKEVTFEFADLGGTENLKVNNGAMYVGDIAGVPVNPAPGVSFSISMTPIPGGKRGIVRLQGPINFIIVGGQEFWLDNICATCQDAAAVDPLTVPAPRLSLAAPEPNPFDRGTTLTFSLPESGPVRLEVVDVTGRRVRLLVDSWHPVGTSSVDWNGRDDADRMLPAGIYFLRLHALGQVAVQKALMNR